MLVKQDDANPDQVDQFCETPLSRTACHGCQGIVRMLLEGNDVNPHK